MPAFHLHLRNPACESFRTAQVAGMFGLERQEADAFELRAELPSLEEPWQIGAIVGPSGAGKSALAAAAFGPRAAEPKWPRDRAVVDAFPPEVSMRRLVAAFGAVGFNSPPAWLRPFHILSQGEQFRCRLAQSLLAAESDGAALPLIVCDEFTSAVDRATAHSASAALARAIRQGTFHCRLVAVTCHTDVLPWLAPDWTLDLATGQLSRGSLRRPRLKLEIAAVRAGAWDLFRKHHYLSAGLNRAAKSFVAFHQDRPVAFSAWMRMGAAGHQCRATRLAYREHRTVVLPEYQGLGIGNRLSEWCGALFRGLGHRVYSTSSHPAMIRHRLLSEAWRKVRFGFTSPSRRPHERQSQLRNLSALRWTASFEYVGPEMDGRTARELIAV